MPLEVELVKGGAAPFPLVVAMLCWIVSGRVFGAQSRSGTLIVVGAAAVAVAVRDDEWTRLRPEPSKSDYGYFRCQKLPRR